VLDEKNIAMVLDFAREHGLAVLADEVYQETSTCPATGSSLSRAFWKQGDPRRNALQLPLLL